MQNPIPFFSKFPTPKNTDDIEAWILRHPIGIRPQMYEVMMRTMNLCHNELEAVLIDYGITKRIKDYADASHGEQ